MNSIPYSVRVFPQVAFPYAQDRIPTFAHIGVLGAVILHPFLLAGIRRGVSRRVAMPVIPVELDDQSESGGKRIHAELPGDQVLWQVFYTEAIKKSVADPLWLGLVAPLLQGIHLDELGVFIGIGVAAGWRAIQYPSQFLKGGRPAEESPACFANILGLISGLPLVGMFVTTKVGGESESTTGDIDLFPADRAVLVFTSLSFWTLALPEACMGAEALVGPASLDGLPACFAGDHLLQWAVFLMPSPSAFFTAKPRVPVCGRGKGVIAFLAGEEERELLGGMIYFAHGSLTSFIGWCSREAVGAEPACGLALCLLIVPHLTLLSTYFPKSVTGEEGAAHGATTTATHATANQ